MVRARRDIIWPVLAVVMNADASRRINVDAEAGVKLDWAIWASMGLFVLYPRPRLPSPLTLRQSRLPPGMLMSRKSVLR